VVNNIGLDIEDMVKGSFDNYSIRTGVGKSTFGGRVGIGTTAPAVGSMLDIRGTSSAFSSIVVPRDTAANRPSSGINGMIRYNTTSQKFEVYEGTWQNMLSAGGGASDNLGNHTATQPILATLGTGSAPSYTFAGAPFTGISAVGTAGLAFSTGSVERMRIDGQGKIGINTTISGGYTVEIGGATMTNQLFVRTIGTAVNLGTSTVPTTSQIVTGTGKLDFLLGGGRMTINGTGSGGPALDVAGTGSNSSILIPRDSSANRPATGINGMIRYNTTTLKFEAYEGRWQNMVGPSSGLDNLGNHTATTQILATPGTAAAPGYTFAGDTDTGIWKAGDDQLALSTGGSEWLRINSSGNVGIGTTNPTSALSLVRTYTGNTDWDAQHNSITVNPAGNISTAAANRVTMSTAGANNVDYLYGTRTSLNHFSSGTLTEGVGSRNFVDMGGIVGTLVGVQSYAKKTGNNATTTINGVWAKAESTTGSTTDQYAYHGEVGVGFSAAVTNAYGVRLKFTGSGSATNAFGIYLDDVIAGNAFAVYQTGGDDLNYFAGKVGIGTAAPASHLDITGTGAIIVPRNTSAVRPFGVNGMIRYNTDSQKFEVYEGTWQSMLSAGGGAADNLGNHTATTQIFATPGTGSAPGYSFNGEPNRGMYAAGTGALAFSTSSLERVRVDAGGNVGIGTTLPAASLHIVSTHPSSAVAPYRTGVTVESEGASIGSRYGAISYSDTLPPSLMGFRSRNTKASPQPVQNNDIGLQVVGYGYDGTNWSQMGAIIISPTQTWTGSARGGEMFFNTGTHDSAAAAVARLHLGAQGNVTMAYNGGRVGINTTAPGALLDINSTGSLESAIIIPRDTAANRPAGLNGMIRYNTDSLKFEVYEGTWQNMIGAGGGGGSSQWVTTGSDIYYNSGFVGVGTTAPDAKLHLENGSLLLTGTGGATPASGAGTRMMWIPEKAAIRAGDVGGAYWDDANIGYGSVAFGANTTASGGFSFAMGHGATASGFVAIALGQGATASGGNSYAIGGGSEASGTQALAMGNFTTASGSYSTSMGQSTYAAGNYSTAMGIQTTAGAYASVAIGRFNVGAGSASSWLATDPVFEIGNGTGLGVNSSNALTVLKSGNMGLGTATPSVLLDVNSTGGNNSAILIPRHTAAQRPSGLNGMIRYNTTSQKFEVYEGTWQNMLSAGGGGSADNLGNHTATTQILATPGTADAPGYSFLGAANLGMSAVGTGTLAFSTSSLERLRINANGTVGINTASVAAGMDFDVNGDSWFRGLVVAPGDGTPNFVGSSDWNTGVGFTAAANSDIVLYTNNNPAMTVANSGSVGVGTTNPSSELDVAGTGAIIVPRNTSAVRPFGLNGMIRYNTTSLKFEVYEGTWQNMIAAGGGTGDNLGNHTATQAILATTGTAATPSYSFLNGANRGMYAVGTGGVGFSTGSLERMRIDTNGYVGIGTASPQYKLDVYGGNNPTAQNDYVINVAEINDSNGVFIRVQNLSSVTHNAGIQLANQGNGKWDMTLDDGTSDDLMFYNYNVAGKAFGANYSNGYVGIGNITAQNRLDVAGAMAIGAYGGVNAAPSNGMIVSGSVGIGTTSPASHLDVTGTGAIIVPRNTSAVRPFGLNGMIRYNTTSLKFEVYEGTWQNMISAGGGGADNLGNGQATTVIQAITGTAGTPSYTFAGETDTGLFASGPNQVALSTGGTERMKIDEWGNVGIGTTPSSSSLHIYGTGVNSTTVTAQNSHAQRFAKFSTMAAGSVYFNLASHGPAENSTLTGGPSFNSAAVLYSSGVPSRMIIATTNNAPMHFGTNNRARMVINGTGSIGIGTATVTPGAILDVSGTSALWSSMIVPRDTEAVRPFGINGMIRYNTTSLKFEVYEGRWQNMVTAGGGAGATAIDQLSDAKTTANNIFMGSGSGDSLVGGQYNSGVGIGALEQNSSGNGNTGVGAYALNESTDGHYNTAVGYSALDGNHSGAFNIAVGTSAGESNDNAVNNVYLGFQAGMDAYGNNNVMIGYNAGNTATSGHNNILIGSGVAKPTVTSSNTLNIGNAIFGDLSGPSIGIGTNAPVGTFHVNSGTSTATTGFIPSVYQTLDVNPAAASDGVYAGANFAATYSSSANSPSASIYGVRGSAFNEGGIGAFAGTIVGVLGQTVTSGSIPASPSSTFARGIEGQVVMDALGGTIGQGAGGYFSTSVTSGTLNNAFGVYTGTIEGINRWSVYASDTTAASYFAGGVGIGTSSPASHLDVAGTGAIIVPRNTAATRPFGVNGMIRYNTDLLKFEVYEGRWQNMISAAGGAGDNLGDHTATTAILAVAGTATAPSYSFSGNADTGLFRVTANTLGLSAGGVTALRANTAASAVNHIAITPAATGFSPTITSAGLDTTGSGLGVSLLGANAAAGSGGPISIITGNGTSAAGQLSLRGGNAGSTGNAGGGDVSITGGNASAGAGAGVGAGGDVNLTAGNATSGLVKMGGLINITAGNAVGGGIAGGIYLNGGTGDTPGVVSLNSTNGGFVGIGTQTPSARLDIFATGSGAGSAVIVPRDTTAFRPTGINGMIRYNTTSLKFEVYEGMWQNMISASPWTTSGSDISNNNAGNVGIGTATPQHKLEVAGTAAAQVMVILGTGAADGAGCPTPGALARDPAGDLFLCK
jgi:hypothetical protein